ncbi:glycosyltransferase [Nocardioides gilvus]|uniref:glycosyltransferase n=1 Tax=Nocardioides gilvus TaxID=1735589 RepID=UPI000D747898|nr:glycosyltransferase [Nocardioides gilvus]
MVNFATGLADLGWEVTVLTVKPNPYNPLERRLDLDIPEHRLAEISVVAVDTPLEVRFLYAARACAHRVLKTLRYFGSPPGAALKPESDDISPNRQSTFPWLLALVDHGYRRAFSQAKGLARGYDALWVSYGPRYMVDVGGLLADRFSSAGFVMDVRDPIVRSGSFADPRSTGRQRRTEAKLAQRADAVTLVSGPLLENAVAFTCPVSVISNGFGELEKLVGNPVEAPDVRRPFTLYYGGRLSPAQDARALAAACRKLNETVPVVVQYAGTDFSAFSQAFEDQNAGQLLSNLGLVSRPDSLAHAKAADVVAVFSWNDSEKGILTGKIFELIALNTPIAVLMVGESRGSALSEMFQGDPMRRVFETSLDEGNVQEIVDFLISAPRFDENFRKEFQGISRYKQYSYPVLCEKLSAVLGSAVESRKLASRQAGDDQR